MAIWRGLLQTLSHSLSLCHSHIGIQTHRVGNLVKGSKLNSKLTISPHIHTWTCALDYFIPLAHDVHPSILPKQAFSCKKSIFFSIHIWCWNESASNNCLMWLFFCVLPLSTAFLWTRQFLGLCVSLFPSFFSCKNSLTREPLTYHPVPLVPSTVYWIFWFLQTSLNSPFWPRDAL